MISHAAVLRITDRSTRAEIAESIRVLKVKHDRLPTHWLDDRREVMDEIDALVDMWIQARA